MRVSSLHREVDSQRVHLRNSIALAVRQTLRAPHSTRCAIVGLAAVGLLAMSTSSVAAFPSVFELTSLDGSNGFVLNGVNANDYSGWSVSGAGDINGDGFMVIVIGAPYASDVSYVVFGRNTAAQGDFPAALDLSMLDGRNGFVVNGVSRYDRSGRSVSSAGDINSDGIVDLVISADGGDINGQEKAASYLG